MTEPWAWKYRSDSPGGGGAGQHGAFPPIEFKRPGFDRWEGGGELLMCFLLCGGGEFVSKGESFRSVVSIQHSPLLVGKHERCCLHPQPPR